MSRSWIRSPGLEDWLIVGVMAERWAQSSYARAVAGRFATVWVPGNHELWTTAKDPDQHRGEERYRELVDRCRGIDVVTPEDEFPVWPYADKPLTVAPLFLLYDYSWRTPRAEGVPLSEALRQAREAGVVCTDEYLLHPDPYMAEWSPSGSNTARNAWSTSLQTVRSCLTLAAAPVPPSRCTTQSSLWWHRGPTGTCVTAEVAVRHLHIQRHLP